MLALQVPGLVATRNEAPRAAVLTSKNPAPA
jgi:hypothetical protein